MLEKVDSGALMQRKKKIHTSLVLDEQFKILDIVAVRIAGVASKCQIGCQSRVILDNIGSRVARAAINCSTANNRGGKMGGGKISDSMHQRGCIDEARAGGKPEQKMA